jgi:hypothetical protein
LATHSSSWWKEWSARQTKVSLVELLVKKDIIQ